MLVCDDFGSPYVSPVRSTTVCEHIQRQNSSYSDGLNEARGGIDSISFLQN